MSQHMVPRGQWKTLHVGSLGQRTLPREVMRNTKGSKLSCEVPLGDGWPRWLWLVSSEPSWLGSRALPPVLLLSGIHPLLRGMWGSKHALTLCVGQAVSEASMGSERMNTLLLLIFYRQYKSYSGD